MKVNLARGFLPVRTGHPPALKERVEDDFRVSLPSPPPLCRLRPEISLLVATRSLAPACEGSAFPTAAVPCCRERACSGTIVSEYVPFSTHFWPEVDRFRPPCATPRLSEAVLGVLKDVCHNAQPASQLNAETEPSASASWDGRSAPSEAMEQPQITVAASRKTWVVVFDLMANSLGRIVIPDCMVFRRIRLR